MQIEYLIHAYLLSVYLSVEWRRGCEGMCVCGGVYSAVKSDFKESRAVSN